MTPLEEAIVKAADLMGGTAFAESVREFNPTRSIPPGTSPDRFIELSRSLGPPVLRLLSAAELIGIARAPAEFGEAPSETVAWALRAATALRRLTCKLWAPMPEPERSVFYDEDDLPMFVGAGFVPQGRRNPAGPVLFDGLESAAVLAAFSDLVREVRTTAAYAAASEAVERLEREPRHHQDVVRFVEQQRKQAPQTANRMISEVKGDLRSFAENFYLEAPERVAEAATAVLKHNRLVNRIVWVLLGIIESPFGLPIIATGVSSIHAVRRDNSLALHFTTEENPALFMLHVPGPLALALDTPLDGLYVCEGYTMRFAGREAMDIHCERLAVS